MSLNLDWIWQWISGVVDYVNSFFGEVWGQAQSIVNTGQGLFIGLSALASALWDALASLGRSIEEFGSFIGELGHRIYWAFNEFGKWIWQTLGNIGNAIFSAFQWIYNALVWVGTQVTNIFQSVINYLFQIFGEIQNALSLWLENVRNTLNDWWTTLIKTMRQKIKKMIVADLTIYLSWENVMKLRNGLSFKGVFDACLTPFIAVIPSYILAEMTDVIVPIPESTTYELIPPITLFSYTPPSVSIPVGEYEAPPTPPPTYGYTGVYDLDLKLYTEYDLNNGFLYREDEEEGILTEYEITLLPPYEGEFALSTEYEVVS